MDTISINDKWVKVDDAIDVNKGQQIAFCTAIEVSIDPENKKHTQANTSLQNLLRKEEKRILNGMGNSELEKNTKNGWTHPKYTSSVFET